MLLFGQSFIIRSIFVDVDFGTELKFKTYKEEQHNFSSVLESKCFVICFDFLLISIFI